MKNWFKKYFSGTGKLTKFILKKERNATLIWFAVLVGLTVFAALVFSGIFKDAEQLLGFAVIFSNPAMTVLLGPVFGETNVETIYTASMLLFTILAAAIMNIFLVIRNTRAEEEKGRYEVVRSLPVGRLSNLTSVLVVAFIINFLISLILGLSLFACGYGFAGSILFGSAVGVGGMLFAGIAALFAQLFPNSSAAVGLSCGVLGFFYLLRGVGDVSVTALAYISPLGLLSRAEIFAGNFLWPILAVLALTAIFVAAAICLNTIRDMGRGIFAERIGRSEGSFLMKSVEGLIFKLTRFWFIIWTFIMLVFGTVYGSVMGEDLEKMIADNEVIKQMLGSMIPEGFSFTEGFISTVTIVMCIIAAIPCLMAILKISAEEKNNRYENILSKTVSKPRIMAAHVVYSFVQSFVMVFAAMFGLWAASSIAMETPIPFIKMFSSFMAYLPAIWVLIGLAALLTGILPKYASVITYSYLGVSFFLGFLGPMLNLPETIQYLTPFKAVPQLLMEAGTFLPFAILTAISACLITIGFFTYRKRDMI